MADSEPLSETEQLTAEMVAEDPARSLELCKKHWKKRVTEPLVQELLPADLQITRSQVEACLNLAQLTVGSFNFYIQGGSADKVDQAIVPSYLSVSRAIGATTDATETFAMDVLRMTVANGINASSFLLLTSVTKFGNSMLFG